MNRSDFCYDLPPDLIAQAPASERTQSRLFLYDRETKERKHLKFSDIENLIPKGDLLVLNATKVIPARIYPFSGESGEILFLKSITPHDQDSENLDQPIPSADRTQPQSLNNLQQGNAASVPSLSNGFERFEAMVRVGRKFKVGRKIRIGESAEIEVESIKPDGLRVFCLLCGGNVKDFFRKYGEMPLPPYITSRNSSDERYQTVFAREDGSIAAPTAGLHFDEKLLQSLREKGVRIGEIVLHVGLGTFKPIETERIEDHPMHFEEFYVSEACAEMFYETRRAGGKVWACGTTSLRTLESILTSSGKLKTGWNRTNLFIKPGYTFKAVDRLITNFHLPETTLLVLVSAVCGLETVLNLYEEAISQKYRFYSFGDAMLIL